MLDLLFLLVMKIGSDNDIGYVAGQWREEGGCNSLLRFDGLMDSEAASRLVLGNNL